MHRDKRIGRDTRDFLQRLMTDSTQTVRADSDADCIRAVCCSATMVGKKIIDAHREAALVRCGLWVVESGALIMHRHVSETNTTVLCRRRNRLEHRVLCFRVFRITVQIMKLGNRGIAAGEHLAIRLASDCGQCRCIHDTSKLVHAIAPGPETVVTRRRSLLGMSSQCTLESVTVCVAQSGNNATHERIARRRRSCVPQAGYATVRYLQPHVVRPPVGQ